MVSDAALWRDGVDRLHAHAVAAVLADQSIDLHRSLVQLPARLRSLPLGGAAGRDPVGREFSTRARLGRGRRERPGASCRRRLCCQHARCDHRLGQRQLVDGGVARKPARPASTRHRLSRVCIADAGVGSGGSGVEAIARAVCRHDTAGRSDGRRGAARAHHPPDSRSARRLRSLRGDAAG